MSDNSKSWAEEQRDKLQPLYPEAKIDVEADNVVSIDLNAYEIPEHVLFDSWMEHGSRLVKQGLPDGCHIRLTIPTDESLAKAKEAATRYGLERVITDEPYVYKVVLA